MSYLTIAAAQIAPERDKDANLAMVRQATERAAELGADLAVFPEATMSWFGNAVAPAAEPLDGPWATAVREIAARHHLLVVVGMFRPADDGRVHNTLLVTGRGVETSYDKINLYDAFGSKESETVAPGGDVVTFEALGTRIGLATCYDLRFASHFTALGREGAELVCVPTAWGDGPGKAEQLDLLARARAMDAQAYLVACDQAWRPADGPKPLGIGRSVIVDPVGGVRARLGGDVDLLVTRIDLDVVRQTRERIPIL